MIQPRCKEGPPSPVAVDGERRHAAAASLPRRRCRHCRGAANMLPLTAVAESSATAATGAGAFRWAAVAPRWCKRGAGMVQKWCNFGARMVQFCCKDGTRMDQHQRNNGANVVQFWCKNGVRMVQSGAILVHGANVVQSWCKAGARMVQFGAIVVQMWCNFGARMVHKLAACVAQNWCISGTAQVVVKTWSFELSVACEHRLLEQHCGQARSPPSWSVTTVRTCSVHFRRTSCAMRRHVSSPTRPTTAFRLVQAWCIS